MRIKCDHCDYSFNLIMYSCGRLIISFLLCLAILNSFVVSERYVRHQTRRHIERGNEDIKEAGKKTVEAGEEYSHGIKDTLSSTGNYLKSISSKGINMIKNTFGGVKEKASDVTDKTKDLAEKSSKEFEERYNRLMKKIQDHSAYLKERVKDTYENKGEDVMNKAKDIYHDTSKNIGEIGKAANDRIRDYSSQTYQKVKEGKDKLGEKLYDTKDVVSDKIEDVVEKGKEVGEKIHHENIGERFEEMIEKGKEIGGNVFDKAVDMGKVGYNAMKDSVQKTIHGLEEVRSNAFLREHAVRLLTVLENAQKQLHYSQKIAEDFIDEVSRRLKEC